MLKYSQPDTDHTSVRTQPTPPPVPAEQLLSLAHTPLRLGTCLASQQGLLPPPRAVRVLFAARTAERAVVVEDAATASQLEAKAASPPAEAVPPATMPPTTMTASAATTAAATAPADGSSMDEDGSGELVVLVKWDKSTFPVELPRSSPLSALRTMLWELTAVRPERQKLFGLTRSPGAGAPSDDVPLSTLITKAEQKVMMMGSTEAKIAAINTAAAAALASNEVADDFDIDYTAYAPGGALAGSTGAGKGSAVVRGLRIHDAAAVADKLRRRVSNLKVKLMHPLRPGRKCLVLDIDYTIYDCRGAAERVADLGRPGLHEFMTAAYQHYDIVMWSQTNWRYLEAKLTELYVIDESRPWCAVAGLVSRGVRERGSRGRLIGGIAGGAVCDAPDASHAHVHWRSPGQVESLAVGRALPLLLERHRPDAVCRLAHAFVTIAGPSVHFLSVLDGCHGLLPSRASTSQGTTVHAMPLCISFLLTLGMSAGCQAWMWWVATTAGRVLFFSHYWLRVY